MSLIGPSPVGEMRYKCIRSNSTYLAVIVTSEVNMYGKVAGI